MLPYFYQIVTNYRLRDSMSMTDTSNKRYIITAPPSDFILLPSDLVFVLMQFDHGTEYQPLLAGQWRLMIVDPLTIVISRLLWLCG